ncbi:hypothetical protein [Picosynechococcus sp. NKBG15041c]|uniref:hypothetical protein n=1 Tax=Picosynechococcus sp. NKBG15041c TaxID=1407650 RepID=UPI0003FD9E8A|nr:hypothetical protein [Picosynechococcus sp. NKBG15041c]
MVVTGRWWQRSIIGTLICGNISIFGVVAPGAIAANRVLAQSTSETISTQSLFTELWLLNQNFLAITLALETIPRDLAAVNGGTQEFDPQIVQDYSASLQRLQAQVGLLETQLAGVEDQTQRAALGEAIADFDRHLKNLADLIQPLETGFNPEAIRRIQEFLDFFEQRNLSEADYGFYGSVTQTELETYLNQQLSELREALKTLNETATQGAIAPDLETSINFLYTSLSLGAALDDSDATFPALIQQLQRDNLALQRRLNTTHFLFALVLFLTGGTLAFLYFQKAPQTKHPGRQYFPDAAPEPFDLDHLEATIIKRLQHTYELKPRQSESTPTSGLRQAFVPPVSPELDIETVAATESNVTSDFEAAFPVQFLNPYDALVDTYNADAQALESQAIALRLQPSSAIIAPPADEAEPFLSNLMFQTHDQGTYWAIQTQGHHYLVPRADLPIATGDQAMFQQVFVCYGSFGPTPQKIKLLKPARVASSDQANLWELVQPGIVVLENIET